MEGCGDLLCMFFLFYGFCMFFLMLGDEFLVGSKSLSVCKVVGIKTWCVR